MSARLGVNAMTGRDTILSQIRRSLRTAHLPDAQATAPGRLPLRPAPSPDEQVVAFRRNLEAVRGRVHGPFAPEAAVDVLIGLLAEAGSEILSWPLEDVGLPGLAEALDTAGCRRVDASVPGDAAGRAAASQRLAAVPIGLTGAQAGLADTGSLVLVHGPRRPRFASLLPPAHVAVLRLSRLWPDLPTYLASRPALSDTSNVVLVTGPSRTADIELIPVFGVHGPKRLDVILVSD